MHVRLRSFTALPIRVWLLLALVAVIGVPLAAMAVVTTLALHGAFTPFPDFERLRADVTNGVDAWPDPMWQAGLTHRVAQMNAHVTLLDASGNVIFRDVPASSPLSLSGADSPASSDLPDVVRLVPPLAVKVPSPSDTAVPGETLVSTVTQPITRVIVARNGQLVGTALFAPDDTQIAARRANRPGRFDFALFELTGPWRASIAFTGLTALLVVTLIAAWLLGRAFLRPLAALDAAARRIAAGNLDFDLPTSRVSEVAAVGTAFRLMAGALRESLYRQAEVEGERRLFITAIVHDLRTPLFALRGYLEGLTTGVARSPQQVAEYLAVCREKVAVLDRLVADLFTYARMEYLEQPPEREPLELGALLSHAAEGLHPRWEERGITLTLDGPGVPCLFEGDGHLLTRAVENLLDNAIRHTPTDGSVHIQWRDTPDGWRFSVADTGAGIAPADLPHLFAPMYRGESSRDRQTGGAGLGLTIARRVLVAHGGDLTVANQPGSGAVFTGTLPTVRSHTLPCINEPAALNGATDATALRPISLR